MHLQKTFVLPKKCKKTCRKNKKFRLASQPKQRRKSPTTNQNAPSPEFSKKTLTNEHKAKKNKKKLSTPGSRTRTTKSANKRVDHSTIPTLDEKKNNTIPGRTLVHQQKHAKQRTICTDCRPTCCARGSPAAHWCTQCGYPIGTQKCGARKSGVILDPSSVHQ